MKNITLLLFIALIASSCDLNQKDKTVAVKNKFSLSVPASFSKQKGLHEDASLQYGNLLNEFFVIVVDEPKAEFHSVLEENGLSESFSSDINGYADILIPTYDETIENLRKSDVVDTMINTMPAKILTLSGRVENMNVFYTVAFVEGKDNYYQIMTWTLANRKSRYSDAMKRLVCSLKEL
ncbi:MAG: hypothetical protein ACK5Z2_07730 [Bacteroidota bacterium]|jgi:hypothetical protein